MSAPQECMSWDDCPALAKVTILDILGPRVSILDSMPDVPPTHGYVYLIFFLPLWRRGEKRFAYIGKKSHQADMTYRGSGSRDEFRQAVIECAPHECVKVFLGVYPRGRNLSRMEHLIQRKVGIPEAGERDDIDHPVWLNRFAYGGSKWNDLTREQLIANGKIGGKIGGRKNGPAAATNMSRLQADLRSSHDPSFWERIPLPPNVVPPGWEKQSNGSRYGIDIPEQAVIVPVARPAPNGPGNEVTLSSSKMARVLMTIYGRSPPTFAEHCADLRAEFPAPDKYGSLSGAKAGVTRDCRKGLFSLVHEGRVILGPGGPESDCHDPRLSWTPARGWRRGRVVSRGPYGWAR